MGPRCVLTDLDRTLTGPDLRLDPRAVERIDALRRAGVLVVVVTGRRLEELVDAGLHERVDGLVAENGAVVCVPGEEVMEWVHVGFADAAREALGDLAGAFRWARVLGSGPRELAAEAGRRLARGGVAHHLAFNAEEVMVLPEGVDKAWGARRCLWHLGLAPEACWAIGDGENDVPMLRLAAVGAVPANAAPEASAVADVRMASAYGQAFLDLTEPLVAPAEPPSPVP